MLSLPRNAVKKIFDSITIDDVIAKDVGYLGYINQNGIITKDSNMLSRIRDFSGIKER